MAATGIDLLAVSVGNIHIALAGRHGSISTVWKGRDPRWVTDVPLVLHGGTGIAAEALKAAIASVTQGQLRTWHQAALSRGSPRRALQVTEPNPQ